MMFGLLALIASAIFAGAAFYVNFAEQPARLTLDDRALLTEWKPAYKRGAMMQAPLAVVGFLFGMLAWWRISRFRFPGRRHPDHCAVALDLIVIKPINDALLATDLDKAGPPRARSSSNGAPSTRCEPCWVGSRQRHFSGRACRY